MASGSPQPQLPGVTLLIFFGLIALSVSFMCSVFEAVLLSVSPSYVAALEGETLPRRRRTGMLLKRLKEDVDRPLAAILTLNTIAHTAGAAGVGAQAQKLYGNEAVTAASVVMTLLILVFSEIIPKTLGAVYWRGLTPVVARSLRVLILLLLPFVWLAQMVTRLFSRSKDATEVSREELGALAELGHREGVIEEKENRMVQNLLRLKLLSARDVMTPRTVAVMLHDRTTVREVMSRDLEANFSRIPVYGENRDDVSGYVLRSELLLAAAHDRFSDPVSEFVRPLARVQTRLPLPAVLEVLLQHREHMALVVDEFGGTAGIVTMEDVVETMLGTEILDETDDAQDLRMVAREKWRQRAAQRGIQVEMPEETAEPGLS